ncbi:peptidase M1, partial [Microbacterium sp. SUBG005]
MSGADPYAPQSGDTAYDVLSYDLTLSYRVRTNRLEGVATIVGVARDALPWFALDLVGLRTSRVRIDGAPARFAAGPRVLRV